MLQSIGRQLKFKNIVGAAFKTVFGVALKVQLVGGQPQAFGIGHILAPAPQAARGALDAVRAKGKVQISIGAQRAVVSADAFLFCQIGTDSTLDKGVVELQSGVFQRATGYWGGAAWNYDGGHGRSPVYGCPNWRAQARHACCPPGAWPGRHKATQGPKLIYLQQAFHFLAESSAKHSTKA